jgi:hypothetical protein
MDEGTQVSERYRTRQRAGETMNILSFCWRSALRDPHDVQVVALNVLSEGVAFDFYTSVIPVLDRLKILSGRYWKIHTDVDAHHLSMGLDICGDVKPKSEKGHGGRGHSLIPPPSRPATR